MILNSLHFSYPLPILMRVSYNTLIVKQNTSDYYKYTHNCDTKGHGRVIIFLIELSQNLGRNYSKEEGKSQDPLFCFPVSIFYLCFLFFRGVSCVVSSTK